jgi:hypothetical protein
MASSIKVPKSKQPEVEAFVAQLHGFGMQFKGMLMMQNLKGIEGLSQSVAATAAGFGFEEMVRILGEVERAAKKGDVGTCMAYVSGFETEFQNLKVEYI